MREQDVKAVRAIISIALKDERTIYTKGFGDLIGYVHDHLDECLVKTLLLGLIKCVQKKLDVPVSLLVNIHDDLVESYQMQPIF